MVLLNLCKIDGNGLETPRLLQLSPFLFTVGEECIKWMTTIIHSPHLVLMKSRLILTRFFEKSVMFLMY
jgi:hypothetical protein